MCVIVYSLILRISFYNSPGTFIPLDKIRTLERRDRHTECNTRVCEQIITQIETNVRSTLACCVKKNQSGMFKKLLTVNSFGINALVIIRIFAGMLIHIHGNMLFDSQTMHTMAESLSKDMGMPFPFLMAYLAKGSEFFGGLLLVLGLFTRFVTIPLIITMAVAAFVAHHGQITGDGEHAFLFLLIFVAFFFIGSGKWSIDYLLKRKKE